LAHYFLLKDDAWISDYFFTKCLDISKNAKLDTRLEAEAHCNLGLAYERQGKIRNLKKKRLFFFYKI
jgi:hypothetical protein